MPSIEERLTALEALADQYTALEQRVLMEAQLRAAADADLSGMGLTLRSVQRLVQSLSITQSDHTATLRRIEREHGTALAKIVTLLDELIRRDNGGAAPAAG